MIRDSPLAGQKPTFDARVRPAKDVRDGMDTALPQGSWAQLRSSRTERHQCAKSMVHPIFATPIFNGEFGLLNLFGVVVGIAPRATMRFAPDDP